MWGWFSSNSSSKDSDNDKSGEESGKIVMKLENALSPDEKAKLYDVIDYQENAHHGIYPKSFVAHKLAFR
jgi:hypothetical protein